MVQPRWVSAFPKATQEQIRLLAEICHCTPRQVVINAVKKLAMDAASKPTAYARLAK